MSSLIPIDSKKISSGFDFDDDDELFAMLDNNPAEKKHDKKKGAEPSLRQQPTIAETQYGHNDFDLSFDDELNRVPISNPINQNVNKIESTAKNDLDDEFSNLIGELNQPKTSNFKPPSEPNNDNFSLQMKSPALPGTQHLVSPNLVSINQQDNASPLQLYETNINHGEIFTQLYKNDDYNDIQHYPPIDQHQNTTPPNYKPPNISPSPEKPTNNVKDQSKKNVKRDDSPRKDTFDSDDFNLDIDFIDDGKDQKSSQHAPNSKNDDSLDWQIDGKPSYKISSGINQDNTSIKKDAFDFDDEFSVPDHLTSRLGNDKIANFGMGNGQNTDANVNSNNNQPKVMFGGPFVRNKVPSRISPDPQKFVIELPPTQFNENMQSDKIIIEPPPPPPHIDIKSPSPYINIQPHNINDTHKNNTDQYDKLSNDNDDDELQLYNTTGGNPIQNSGQFNIQIQQKTDQAPVIIQQQGNLNDKKTRDSASMLRNELNNFKKKSIETEEQKKLLELKLNDMESKHQQEIDNLRLIIDKKTVENQDLTMEIKSLKELNTASSSNIKEKEEFYLNQIKEKDNMIQELKKFHQSKSEDSEAKHRKEIEQLSSQYRDQIDNMRVNHDKEIERLKSHHAYDLNQRESILNDKNNIDQLSTTMKLNSDTLTNLLVKFNMVQDELTKNKLVEFKSKEIVFGQIEQSINIQKQQLIQETEKLNELLHHIEGREMSHEAKNKENETRMRQESIRLNNMIESIKDENKILKNSINEEKLKIKEERARLLKDKTEQELLLNDKFEQVRLKERSLESEIQNVKQEKEQYIQLKNRLKVYQDNLEKELFDKQKEFNEKENLLSNRERDLIYKLSDIEKKELGIDLRSKDLERQEEKLRIFSENLTNKSNELSSLINKLHGDKDQFERQKNLAETQLMSQTKEMEYRKGQLDEQIKQLNKQRTDELRSKYLTSNNMNTNTITEGFNRTSPYEYGYDNINKYNTMANPTSRNHQKSTLLNNYSNTQKLASYNKNTRQSRPNNIDDIVYSALASAKSLAGQIY